MNLHFLRPEWLWALCALPVIAWVWLARGRRENAWRETVDAHLLPHLLEPASNVRTRGTLLAVLLAFALAVLALAGPAWKQIAQPAWQSRTPLVIAVDMSSASLADDVPPTRLLRARAKIATLLQQRAAGQVGLIAFADDAYTVAPLTDDAANVALFLDSLAPDVMPTDGHRPDRAIARATELLRQAGFDRGDILVITDHGDDAANAAATNAGKRGMRVSVLGLGSEAGTVVTQVGGGGVRVALDAASLRALANAGGGRYAPLSLDDADLRAIDILQTSATDATSTQGRAGRSWEDAGYWLLPPLMLIAVFAFRRGAGVAAMLLVCCLPMGFAHAQEGTLWRRADQVAAQRMDAGEAAYRAGKFDDASRAYDGVRGADGQYNLGNALAKQGSYEEAIAAYDRALQAQPGMPDAVANRRAVLEAMKRKPPSGNSKKNDPRAQGNKGEQQKKQGGDSQSKQQQQAQQQPKPQQKSQAGKPSPSESKPADAKAQQQADAAQRQRMQQAMAKQQQTGKEQAGAKPAKPETQAERERRLANEAWLRRVPDDPGGLLRAKFRLEYERRQLEGGE